MVLPLQPQMRYLGGLTKRVQGGGAPRLALPLAPPLCTQTDCRLPPEVLLRALAAPRHFRRNGELKGRCCCCRCAQGARETARGRVNTRVRQAKMMDAPPSGGWEFVPDTKKEAASPLLTPARGERSRW